MTTNQSNYDLVIIGGGIVGLSVAMESVKRGLGSVLVIEAEEGIAKHQTGNNSGVIHSGLYYRPNSLRAKNCIEGRELMYSFCAEHDIPHENCGKLVIAVQEEEIPRLDQLEERGLANGLKLKRLRKDEIQEYEPNAVGVAGLWVPETGIVNYRHVAKKFGEIFKSQGGNIITNCKLLNVEKKSGNLKLMTSRGEISAKYLINCGGVQADRIARMCGYDPKMKIIPFRGEYYDLINDGPKYIQNLIYPVPDPQFPFLGVHFTRRIEGGVEAGPNAVLAFSRNGYKFKDINLKDIWEIVSYKGFWRLIGRHWGMGIAEVQRSFSKRLYLKSLQKMIPSLKQRDIQRGGAGVRAQILGLDGKLFDDFLIESDESMIHVLNAPSPAATASISIGRTIVDIAVLKFE